MYTPSHFSPPDRDAMLALMRAYPLATLVHQGADGLDANHIPLRYLPELGPHGVLQGHVARANPLWREIGSGAEVLAVFAGPDTYVSPSWYASKREHGRVVPTWNYAVVHAHGTLRAIDDTAWLERFLIELTATHEAHRSAPWQVHDAPRAYLDANLRAIVGIELTLARLEGKWKLSQNRGETDRAGVVAGLAAETHATAGRSAELVRDPRGGFRR
jgi:transcriptional regulator